MTEIATEDDLWKLFSKNEKSHKRKGEGFVEWSCLNRVLSAKSFGNGTQALDLKCEDRFYHIVGSQTYAVVRQCDLRKVGRVLNSMSGDIFVGYLGANPERVSAKAG